MQNKRAMQINYSEISRKIRRQKNKQKEQQQQLVSF